MKRIVASFLALGLVTGPIMAAPAVAQSRSEQGEARTGKVLRRSR